MSRWRAGSIHFAISLAVFLLLLTVIFSLWYPGILFSIDGGWNGLRILIGVDLVLGPLLTLIVFKSGKPGLKFDLGCIATAQALCIAGGMWVVYQERPLALVLAYDTIYSLAAKEFADYERDPAVLDSIPGKSPKLIYAALPDSSFAAEIANIRSAYNVDQPLFIQTERYQALPDDAAALDEVFRYEQGVRERFQKEYDQTLEESCLLSQFISAVTSGYVCFDRDLRALSTFYAYSETAAASEADPD